MKQDSQFLRGVLTALVTPFNQNGSIDFAALDALVGWQLQSGIAGFVPCGTTGESATLTAAEREQVIVRVVKTVAGRVPVVGGAGSNDTAAAIEVQKLVSGAGADYALVATPYYNKPTPEGLFRHYSALVEAVDLPIIVYNIPGRTACDMKPEIVGRVAKLPRILGIKEATGDLDRVSAIRELTGPNFAILSGEDHLTFPFVALGGNGVISATSNIAPAEMVQLTSAALAGDVPTARKVHELLRPLFKAVFLETNPIPMKAALALMGRVREIYRLPMCEMQPQTKVQLVAALRAGGWMHP